MGKIVALGGGCFDNGEMYNVAEHIVKMSGKTNGKFLFVPTAGFDDINGDEPLMDTFAKLGFETDILFLTDKALTREEIGKKILGADIIYAGGGNLRFLAETWKATGADEFMKKAFEKGTVLSGLSSGAMCWFERGYDDCGENQAFEFIDCLGLLPYCNCPHYESDYWQVFTEAVKEQDLSGIACDNGAAFVFEDGRYYCISGNEGGEVYFLDANDGYRKINITNNTDILTRGKQ